MWVVAASWGMQSGCWCEGGWGEWDWRVGRLGESGFWCVGVGSCCVLGIGEWVGEGGCWCERVCWEKRV